MKKRNNQKALASVVTDAFSVAALLQDHEVAAPLKGMLGRILISSLAFVELLSMLEFSSEDAQHALERIGIAIVPFDASQAILAWRVIGSRGDEFPIPVVAGWCVAIELGASVFTCDPDAPPPPEELDLESLPASRGHA